ncbi:hypothetical protein T492DRAFT_840961 [Pavlovales sp. CCMP2436]|nr:hypothetical protein T492DRAFT_840961 [Pavlovales sp. CCMP2436]
MANIFGRGITSSLQSSSVKVDPYVVETSAVTLVSYSSDEVPQNQTRDITKIFIKKFPDEAGNNELVFPFVSILFTSPLAYVAEASLPSSLSTVSSNAVGVQWCFSESNPISAGCVAVLGDTKALQSEGTTDVVSETTFNINVLKYTPGGTQQRLFSWGSMDTPDTVCEKWMATMEPSVSYSGGAAQSYGHAALSYDIPSGKFVDRFYGNSASKTTLGLRPSTLTNIRWELNMNARSFENVSRCAYIRAGAVIESTKRITIDISATGSQGTTVRQVKYDITRMIDEQNYLLDFFDPLRKYTLLISNSDVLMFAGDTEITRNQEEASPVLFYSKIYKPVLRICGGTIVGDAYAGVVSPISRLTALSDDSRALTLSDFVNKRLPTTIGHNSFFSGDIIGRSTNGDSYGDSYNVIDTLESLVGKKVEILSCTPTLDSWLVTTDNTGNVQYHVTPAYSTEDIEVFTKHSPLFVNNINITSSPDWNNSEGWRVVSSSTFQNNASYAANAAFDKTPNTYWGSADGTFTSAGVGSQFLTIEYPQPFKISSLRFEGSTRYPGSYFHEGNRREWFNILDPIGIHLLSAYPVSTSSFKIIMGSADGRTMSMINSPMTAWKFFITIIKDLARASYLPLDQAATFGDSLGFTLDRQLSQVDTLVYTDKRTGKPTIVHRGSTTPRDFLVDDALIAFGSGRETQRQRRAREITAAAETKYNKPSNSTGHSLGGRLAERSGSRGSIITFNKAAGLADIPSFNFTGRSQPQIQNGSRQTDVRTRLDPVSVLSSLGRRPTDQAPLVVVPQRDQANRFLPGPVRLFVNAAKAHSLKNLKQSRTDCYQVEMRDVKMAEKMSEKTYEKTRLDLGKGFVYLCLHKMDVTSKNETEDPTNNSTDKVHEEINNIQLTIPRFDVDNALGDIPAPLPAQHMFACFLGPPRSGKTSLSTALLTQTSPKVYNNVFDNVWLFVPATSFASMSDSPFRNHDKVIHELDKATLDTVIVKLEAASKKK